MTMNWFWRAQEEQSMDEKRLVAVKTADGIAAVGMIRSIAPDVAIFDGVSKSLKP